MKVAEAADGAGAEVWRQRAQTWFAEDLDLRARQLDEGRSGAISVRLALGAWRVAGELAGVREEARLAGLPEPERARWRELWASSATLEERAQVAERER